MGATRLHLTIALFCMNGLVCGIWGLPSSCQQNHLALICKNAHKMNVDKWVKDIVSDITTVEFIILLSRKSLCSCRTSHFVKKLKDTDVIVVTSSHCEWIEVQKCIKDIRLNKPLVTNGLVVSRNDSKLHWAVRYHLTQLWEDVNDIRQASLRAGIYEGIIQDLKGVIEKDQESKQRKKHRLILKALLKQIQENSKKSQGVTTSTTESPEYVKMVDYDLDLIRQLPDIDNFYNEYDRDPKEKRLEFETESQLESNLQNALDDIKRFSRGNNKKIKKKRNNSSKPFDQKYDDIVKSTKYRIIGLNKPCNPKKAPCSKKNKHTLWRSSRSTSKGRSPPVRPLYLFPYKVYAGGEFVDLYDTFAVKLAMSRDVTMTYGKVVTDLMSELESDRERQKETNETKKNSISLAKSESYSTKPPKIESSMDNSHNYDVEGENEDDSDEGDGENVGNGDEEVEVFDEDDKFDDGIYREDEDDDDDDDDLEDDNDAGVDETKDEAKHDSATNSTGGAVKTGKSKSKSIEKAASAVSESREYDHRIKSFVVFFVAILGIIVIISILVVMAVRGKGNFMLEGMFLDKTERQKRMQQLERDSDNKTQIIPVYDGVPVEKMLSSNVLDPLESYNASDIVLKRTSDDSQKAEKNILDSDAIPENSKQNSLSSQRSMQSVFEEQRADLEQNSTRSSPESANTLKRFHTPDSRPKYVNLKIPKDPFPKNQLGGQHVIVDFGKDKVAKGKEKAVKHKGSNSTNNSNSLDIINSSRNSSRNSGPDGRQRIDTSLVSFLDSIDNQNGGILRFDHRAGTPWT